MMFMTAGIEMQTVFGDPSSSGGFWNKVVSAGKRVLTGESILHDHIHKRSVTRPRTHRFCSPLHGQNHSHALGSNGWRVDLPERLFPLRSPRDSSEHRFPKEDRCWSLWRRGIHHAATARGRDRIGARRGCADAPSAWPRRTTETGYRMHHGSRPSVQYDIQFVGGVKNTLFGGEGLFIATVTGPGPIWLQSLPFSRLAGSIVSAAGGHRQAHRRRIRSGWARRYANGIEQPIANRVETCLQDVCIQRAHLIALTIIEAPLLALHGL